MLGMYLFIKLKLNNEKKDNVRVLIFHGIKKSELLKFDNLISNLNKKWNFVSPNEFILHIKNKKILKGKNLLITFDDGFLSSYIAFKKVLEPKLIKIIFFIASDFIICGKDENLSRKFINSKLKEINYKFENLNEIYPLSTENIRELAQSGNLIGSHTVSHANMKYLYKKNRQNELKNSKFFLQNIVNSNISEFAYPFGSNDAISISSAKDCYDNYDRIYSGCRGNNKPLQKFIFRDTITISDPLFFNHVYLSGLLDKKYLKKFSEHIFNYNDLAG